MKHLLLILPLLFVAPAMAQDEIAQAKKLEATAEKLLDQGKRVEAFDALAKAALLRDKARDRARVKAATSKKQPKKATQKKTTPKPKKPATVDQVHTRLDRALAKGDIKAAQAASKSLRRAHSGARKRQNSRLAALEKQLGMLEQQLNELRMLLER